jgi:large subunit ribosomal protein L9
MKVILIKDVSGLGRAGDVKDVADGYGRNFIVGKGFGVVAAQSQIDRITKEQKEKAAKTAKEISKLADLHNRINNHTVTIKKPANGNKLFAGVHEADIINAIKSKFGVEVTSKQIKIIKGIKTTGNHTVKLRLSPEHQTLLTISVEPSN